MPPSDIEPLFTSPGFSGQDVPFYGLTFTKKGKLEARKTKAAVIERINVEDFTDVIIFSHGWNNEWDHAIDLYKRFLDGVGAVATEHADKIPAGTKPLMIGISWPSAALVWPWDRAPDIASIEIEPDNDLGQEPDDLDILTDGMTDADVSQLHALVDGKETLTAHDIDQLAILLAPTLGEGPPDDKDEENVTTQNLAVMLKAKELTVKPPTTEDDDAHDPFTDGGTIGGDTDDAAPAGIFSDLFGLRKVLRLATVRKMKDRAGVVGRADVAKLVTDILAMTNARLHLVGHSYGTKVVMSAAVRANMSRNIASALLLQPAVNHLAFATDIGDGQRGGFFKALARIDKPILSTQSRNDIPLRQIFQLAVTRKRDIGEDPGLAAWTNNYVALGGFGPSGVPNGDLQEIPLPAKGDGYPDPGGALFIALEGSGKILGHSKVSNDFTFWAMLQNLKS